MILKNILLLFNIFILLVFQALFGDGINVTQNFPTNVQPGTEFTVEITVNKGDISGFAKFAQELPEGFTASAGELAGGNFSFTDKNIKIIWMSLPADKEFKINYKVTAGANVSGTFPVGAKLSYLENNEKKTFDVAPVNVTVGAGSAQPVAETPATPVTTEQNATAKTDSNVNPNIATLAEVAQKADIVVAEPATSPTTEGQAQTGSASAKRIVPEAATGEFIVEISINKGSAAGFAKLEENVPLGFNVTAMDAAGSNFSFVDSKVKFLWMSLPSSDNFKVSYRITPPSDFKGEVKLTGLFNFLENDETRKAVVEQTITKIGAEEAVAVTPTPEPTKTPDVAAAKTTETDNVAATGAESTTPVNKITSPSSKGGIIFRVQVCAVHKEVPPTYFNENYKIQGEVFPETHEGWFKYTTGEYDQYKQARDRRVELAASGFVNTRPFVTSYNSGKRITVQEALMISNQKWVQ